MIRLIIAAAMLAAMFVGTVRAEPVRYDWSGVYVGINVGRAWGTQSGSSYLTDSTFTLDTKGNFWGGQLGFNQQWGQWVGGLETDYQLSAISGSASVPYCPAGFGCFPTINNSEQARISNFGTVRARLGYAIDRFLPYGTIGLGFGQLKYTSSINFAGCCTFMQDNKRFGMGLAAGGGIEAKILRNLSAKIEYLYVGLDAGGSNNGTFGNASVKAHENIVRLGLNYQF